MREAVSPSPLSQSCIPARGHNHPRIQADSHACFGFFNFHPLMSLLASFGVLSYLEICEKSKKNKFSSTENNVLSLNDQTLEFNYYIGFKKVAVLR